jgi:hypothetical protein
MPLLWCYFIKVIGFFIFVNITILLFTDSEQSYCQINLDNCFSHLFSILGQVDLQSIFLFNFDRRPVKMYVPHSCIGGY